METTFKIITNVAKEITTETPFYYKYPQSSTIITYSRVYEKDGKLNHDQILDATMQNEMQFAGGLPAAKTLSEGVEIIPESDYIEKFQEFVDYITKRGEELL